MTTFDNEALRCYKCWAVLPGGPLPTVRAFIAAPSSFMARKEYAAIYAGEYPALTYRDVVAVWVPEE